ncbi:transcriptional regulator [Plantactinospora sp. GCM10030261]|uniref:transcriptional regulator n=1 Tax=Plantactinospora sp. GCM10030261 TaxID=3273420 RepID=UPI00360A3281
MVAMETADMVARRRFVSAQAIFERRADLSGYPFRLLSVISERGLGMDQVSAVMAAAEMLMPHGWDLVNITESASSNRACAVMRRQH